MGWEGKVAGRHGADEVSELILERSVLARGSFCLPAVDPGWEKLGEGKGFIAVAFSLVLEKDYWRDLF